MPRQLSDSAHCYLEYYTRRHLVTCHPRFSRMWWLDKYWGTGLKTTKWNLSFHDLMSTRSFVINHEQWSWTFDANTNPITSSMSSDSEDFVTRQQWGYFEFTPMFISMFNPNVHHNVHPNVHSNVHPNVHPNSTSPFIIPVSSVSLPGWKSTFFLTKHRRWPRWMLVGEVWRDDKTQQLNVLLPQYSVALLLAWRI